MLFLRKIHFLHITVAMLIVTVCLLQSPKAGKPGAEFHASGTQTTGTPYSPAASPSNPAEVQEMSRAQVEASYASLPLSFEPNRGQTDPRVKFVSRAGTRTLWLTRGEAVLAVRKPSPAADSKTGKITSAVLHMKFVAANSEPVITGEDRQVGIINYFRGPASAWRTRIPTYGRVRYSRLYPGIDLVFYGNNRQLEYDLLVAPGADPGNIKLAITGAKRTRIDEDGNLVMETAAGNVVQQRPRIYQRRGEITMPLSGQYVMLGENEIGFRLEKRDPQAEVIIDPVLRYSTFLGGSTVGDLDKGFAITVDSSNRAVVAGFTCSGDFPLTRGIAPPEPRFCSAFVTKFDFTGSKLIFSDIFGGDAVGSGIAVDHDNNVYVTGTTRGPDFPTTPGAFQRTFGGGFGSGDAFVTKLNPSGTALLYSTFLGGDSDDEGLGIATDAQGNAYVTGFTLSKNFPTTSGAFQRVCKLNSAGGCGSTFVTKLNSTGSRALYSTFLNGANTTIVIGFGGIAVDRNGNAFVTGTATSSDFPTTAGSAQPVFGGIEDAFVTEISASGSHLIYSTFLGGKEVDQGHSIALDSAGHAFVTGGTLSTNFPVKGAFQEHCALTKNGCQNAFVTKLDGNGRILYSTYLGGGNDVGNGIATTKDGQAYIIGTTEAADFPTTQTAFQRLIRGPSGAFLTKFDPSGKLIFSTFLGGNTTESFPAIAVDRDANAYVTGAAVATFPVTPGAFQTAIHGTNDAFVSKVVPLCALRSTNRTVTICTPLNGSAVRSPVDIIAGTTDVTPVKLMQVYLDGHKIYETRLSAIAVRLPISKGRHRLTVQGLDTNNVFFNSTVFVTVGSK